MTELFAGATSYWLVLAKSGGGGAGAAGGTCCPGSDGGAASRAVFLGPGDLALAARTVRRCRGRGRSGGLALVSGTGVAGARAVWRHDGWQDLRAVHDSRGPCSEKRPFPARSSRGVSSNGDLRGISDAWRAYLAKASSFRMHGARILPRTGGFPARGRFRDAWSAKLATDCRPGTHRGGILPRQGTRERIAREYCHCQSGQECIRAQSCRRRTLGNASREHFAIVERPGTHQGIILPRPDARAERPARPCATAPAWPTAVAPSAPPFAYATRHPDAAGLRVLQVVRALAVAQPADCRVAAERVVNIAKLVSVPQRRSATKPCATIPCAAAPQRHALQHHDAMHRTRRFCRR